MRLDCLMHFAGQFTSWISISESRWGPAQGSEPCGDGWTLPCCNSSTGTLWWCSANGSSVVKHQGSLLFGTCASLLCWLMLFMDYKCPEQLFSVQAFDWRTSCCPDKKIFPEAQRTQWILALMLGLRPPRCWTNLALAVWIWCLGLGQSLALGASSKDLLQETDKNQNNPNETKESQNIRWHWSLAWREMLKIAWISIKSSVFTN